jgi:hypothetical protein
LNKQKMINTLYEIIFERLDESVAIRLANSLTAVEICLPDPQQGGVWETTIDSLVINSDVSISNAHLRIVLYEVSFFDVELNFILADVFARSKNIIQSSLHNYVSNLADRYGINSYFGGMEPAIDLETRIFTGPILGPLKL